MSITISGAEFAPILTRTVIDLGPEGSEFQIEREIRWRADVTDPDDQRAIYRIASAKLGGALDNRLSARFAWQWTRDVGHRWCLIVGDFDASIIWEGANDVDDRATATAALCRAVWGPR